MHIWSITRGLLTAVVVTVAVLYGAYTRIGAAQPLACAFSAAFCPEPRFSGSVEPKFQPVRTAFQQNFLAGSEKDAQLVIRKDGKPVVDLVGVTSKTGYDRNTIQQVFSSGKMLEVLVVLVAVEKGWLDYDQPVSKYWPAFAQHGKEKITVADVMRHEAGLVVFRSPVSHSIMQAYTNGDPTPMAELIESSEPFWPASSKRTYHAMSRGWIVGELIRHVDPKQRLLHTFLKQEIIEPLSLNAYWPTPASILNNPAKYSPLEPVSPLWAVSNALLPHWLDGRVPFIPPLADADMKRMLDSMGGSNNALVLRMFQSIHVPGTAVGDMLIQSHFDSSEMRDVACGTSFGIRASAEALSIIADVFLHRGLYKAKNVRLFSEATFTKGAVMKTEVGL